MKHILNITVSALIFIGLITILHSCRKTSLPIVTTTEVTEITSISAISGGNVTNNGGAEVTARGVCWSTSQNPNISSSNKTSNGTGNGTFTSNLTNLSEGVKYYVRAYATNSEGTVYGEEINFLATGVIDTDGNKYKTIKIGNQLWMAENLRVAHFKNGTIIPLVTDNTAWNALTTPGYCWYNNDEATNKATYGALYNWYTVNTGNLCPTGWHVPTDAEWTTLTTYLGGESVAGGKLKETGIAHWASPNTGATNETGFTALPGGGRSTNGPCYDVGYSSVWWSSTAYSTTSAWSWAVGYFDTNVYRGDYNKQGGFSVRCLRDF
jgi:uncharacterized protein (TIGR02145 family)